MERDRSDEFDAESFARALRGEVVTPPEELRQFVAAIKGEVVVSPEDVKHFSQCLLGKADLDEQEHRDWVATVTGVYEADWDPSKHPRGFFSQNLGWFSPTSGSGGKKAKTPGLHLDQPAKPAVPTKPQLPAAHRGTWISGSKGHGVFRYNDSPENQQAGLAGKEVRFGNQNIAVGGLPEEAYYRGSAELARVEIDLITGLDADSLAADIAMREKLGDPTWSRPKGYVWNHAGPPGSRKMELVNRQIHESIGHKGPAAEPRAARRIARANSATGRAIAVLTIYMTTRDLLRASGVLKPEYEVLEREVYCYVSDDGSEFIVHPGGLFSSAHAEFISGPRKGQSQQLTSAEVDKFRKQGEELWGKYIPGSLFSEPRFIPGTMKSSIPFYELDLGIPVEAGWIDATGVHRFKTRRPPIL